MQSIFLVVMLLSLTVHVILFMKVLTGQHEKPCSQKPVLPSIDQIIEEEQQNMPYGHVTTVKIWAETLLKRLEKKVQCCEDVIIKLSFM